jgi:hypothetical protein
MLKNFSTSILLASLLKNGGAFAPISSRGATMPSTASSFFGQTTQQMPRNTQLCAGADMIPDVMGQECIITPEGYGFASGVDRILKKAGRSNGFYRAKASDLVVDVMEGITTGDLDVALVFDDDTAKLVGIFTETDYIKVRLPYGMLKYIHHFFASIYSSVTLCSSQWREPRLPVQKRNRQHILFLQ